MVPPEPEAVILSGQAIIANPHCLIMPVASSSPVTRARMVSSRDPSPSSQPAGPAASTSPASRAPGVSLASVPALFLPPQLSVGLAQVGGAGLSIGDGGKAIASLLETTAAMSMTTATRTMAP